MMFGTIRRQPYDDWTAVSDSIFHRLASCMANLSKFYAVFSSSTLIRVDMDAFEGHLCQTVNNFVKQNKSSLLSPLSKRRPSQHIKHIRNTRVF